jgi:hypothetical protein
MAKQNRIILKGYFNTGDTPTEEQFADLIDSFAISLSELGDINLTNLQDGFILAFNQTTNKWIVRNLPIPVYALSELDDVDLTGAIDTNVLVFSQILNKWVPGSITIPMISAGDGLKKVGEIISLGLPSSLGASSVNSVSTETHSHSIDSSIARSERSISGGEGLIGGGNLTEDRIISLSEHNHQESGSSGGKLDHGSALIGLDDDDHPQYWNDTRGANKIDQHISADDHTQYWNDIRGGNKITQHISADDHIQYWNDARGNNKIDTKISDHNLIKTAHGLISPTAINDFMIASGIGTWSKKTLDEVKNILGVVDETDILAITNPLYAPLSHTHSDYAPIEHVGSGGEAHSLATISLAGFMSSVDKAKLDDIDGSKIILKEGSTPSTPAAGQVSLYAKDGGLLYTKDDLGIEKFVGGYFDGWIPINIAPVYVSATSIRFENIDLSDAFPIGTKIKFTQTTVKYFYVIGVSFSGGHTVLTVRGGNNYSTANAAITDFAYAHGLANNFPEYFNWSPTISADNYTISNIAINAVFKIDGKTLILEVYASFDLAGGNGYYVDCTFPFTIKTANYRTFSSLENDSSALSPGVIYAPEGTRFRWARKDRAYWTARTGYRMYANGSVQFST